MKLRQSEQTVVTLANADELVFNIAKGVVGNAVADSIAGNPLNRETILSLANLEFQKAVSKYTNNAGAK